MTESVDDVGRRIDEALAEPAHALVRAYFDRAGPFASDTFETLGDNPPNEVSSDDLLALTTLNVQLRPLALRRLLGQAGEEARRLLSAVPADIDLWEAPDAELSVAVKFWDFLRLLPGVDWVIAGKLGARKRPRLIPVLDSVTVPMLGAPTGNVWATLRDSLSDADRRARVESLRPDGITSNVSLIRLLDVVLWMRGSESSNARDVRVACDLAITPR